MTHSQYNDGKYTHIDNNIYQNVSFKLKLVICKRKKKKKNETREREREIPNHPVPDLIKTFGCFINVILMLSWLFLCIRNAFNPILFFIALAISKAINKIEKIELIANFNYYTGLIFS